MTFFGSLLQLNNALAQTNMSTYDQYQETWTESRLQQEKDADFERDGASWTDNAKERTQSIVSALDAGGTYFHTFPCNTDGYTAVSGDATQLKDFYNPEISTVFFGEKTDPTAEKLKHVTPIAKTEAEGQTDRCVCPCCQLPVAPSSSPSSQCSAPSTQQRHTPKDSCCECYCPDIKMPKEGQWQPSTTETRIRRRSSLSTEERKAELSVGAWL